MAGNPKANISFKSYQQLGLAGKLDPLLDQTEQEIKKLYQRVEEFSWMNFQASPAPEDMTQRSVAKDSAEYTVYQRVRELRAYVNALEAEVERCQNNLDAMDQASGRLHATSPKKEIRRAADSQTNQLSHVINQLKRLREVIRVKDLWLKAVEKVKGLLFEALK
jgi:hypothetical protein